MYSSCARLAASADSASCLEICSSFSSCSCCSSQSVTKCVSLGSSGIVEYILCSLPIVKGVARRKLGYQSEANKGRYPPLPLPSCSHSFNYCGPWCRNASATCTIEKILSLQAFAVVSVVIKLIDIAPPIVKPSIRINSWRDGQVMKPPLHVVPMIVRTTPCLTRNHR